MRHFFSELISAVKGGEVLVLSTIVSISGTTPRSAGSFMAVSARQQFGTVGGGIVEFTAANDAKTVLQTGKPLLKEYSLDDHGTATILHRLIYPADLAALQTLLNKLSCRQSGTLILSAQTLSVTDEDLSSSFADEVFYLPLHYGGTVYLFGAGHVAQATVPLLQSVDFPVVVYDNRRELCQSPAFAAADTVICAPFTELTQHISITKDDYAILMTSGFEADRVVLPQVMQTPARYIGLLGSLRKIELLQAQLGDFSADDWQRFHAPIGIEIGGETPAEVAISAVAQLIQERSNR